MAITDGFNLHVRDRHTLLRVLCGALAAEDTFLSIEGDLSKHHFPVELVRMAGEAGGLRRNTIAPVQGFVTLPLTPETARATLRAILPGGHLPRCVHHVQISRGGKLLFGAYDNFHEECVWVAEAIPILILDLLITNGTLWSYAPRAADRSRE